MQERDVALLAWCEGLGCWAVGGCAVPLPLARVVCGTEASRASVAPSKLPRFLNQRQPTFAVPQCVECKLPERRNPDELPTGN